MPWWPNSRAGVMMRNIASTSRYPVAIRRFAATRHVTGVYEAASAWSRNIRETRVDAKRWSLVQDKFDAALALTSPERDAFVARIKDSLVRDEVSSLLRAHETGDSIQRCRRPHLAAPCSSKDTRCANSSTASRGRHRRHSRQMPAPRT